MIWVAGSLGTLNAKITNLNFGRTRVGILQSSGLKPWTGQKPQLYSCLSISRRPDNVLRAHSGPSLETLRKFFLLMYLFACPPSVIRQIWNLIIGTQNIKFVGLYDFLLNLYTCYYMIIHFSFKLSKFCETEVKMTWKLIT